MKLKDALRKKRFEMNLTQIEAAKLMGVKPYYISKLEHGLINNPHPGTVKKIAAFMCWSEEKVRKSL